ncbi:hypothetical protein [Legionella worsleiensis]|uniref:Secreted endonuclease n=1 Tax=Legionella worsleiensis TaxID=45076 RepID=A0A0W1AKV4_9GAMM|nr:hypothetical protein [Legionella worsleiensis]KTD81995.1 secreted endonuclease [Legionella worsleiensis]STY30371.1 secreted endonuclease [Legionella worsleiensis]
MNKYLVMIFITLGLTACSERGEHYYRANPKELQMALESCPGQKPSGISCEQLAQLGRRLNSLAYQLQLSPQGFGNKILAIQQTIAEQKSKLNHSEGDSELKAALAQNEHDLADCLAVVKWLESPES